MTGLPLATDALTGAALLYIADAVLLAQSAAMGARLPSSRGACVRAL